jgi:hypothetical protein
MKIQLLSIILFCCTQLAFGQFTSTQNGSWQTGATWGGTAPAITGLKTNNITVNHNVVVGSSGSPVGLAFSASGDSKTITINQNLTVYGDVTFGNKGMNLVITDGAILMIVGNLTLANQFTLSSGGYLVVTGAFNKNGGGSATFSGDGAVYAGSYNAGADALVPGDATSSDQQQLITDLSTDIANAAPGSPLAEALGEIEAFLNPGGSTPLPITLKNFNLKVYNNAINLDWTTLSEENFDYFEIQRASQDGIFETIHTIKGNGTSTDEINYSWIDLNPLEGLSYYRLESVDFDGYREIFPMATITFHSEQKKFTIYPNQVIEGGTLSFGGIDMTSNQIAIVDNLGVVRFRSQNTNSIDLPMNLKRGIYQVICTQEGKSQVQRVIVK